MCGIVGIVSSYGNGLSNSEADAFGDMLLVDTLRGFDSTGTYCVNNKGDVNILKTVGTGARFIRTPEYYQYKAEVIRNGMFLVGHNRAATRGEVKEENAHPFWVDDKIVLVQNGTYKGDHSHHKKTEVDTHAIAHVIAEHDDVEQALQRINAAYALVWYNVATKKLHLIRNDERPLFLAYTKTGSVMFASEPEFILMAASRNHLELKHAPYLMASSTLVTYELNTKERAWVQEEKTLDIKYDYKHYPFRAGWQDQQSLGEFDDGFCAFGAVGNVVRRYQVHNSNVNQNNSNSKYLSNRNFHDVIYHEKFKPYQVNAADAFTLSKEYRDKFGKTQLVEYIDYIHANDEKDCHVFFIIARPINPDHDDDYEGPEPIFFMLSHGRDEDTVMKMCTFDTLQLVEVGTVIINTVDTESKVVSVMFSKPQKVVTLNNVIDEEKRVH